MKAAIFSLLFSILLLPKISFSQTRQFQGEWTKEGTTYIFSFTLHLQHKGEQVEGFFDWKVDRLNEGDSFSESWYKKRIGLTAKEFVRGTYNSRTKEYWLKGYRKEDPESIIGIDTYQLKMDPNGDIGGDTSAGGTWLGRINGKGITIDST